MATWAQRRRAKYIGTFITGVVILSFIPAYYLTRTTPTCVDGKQNQDEVGVDCGGSCPYLCASQVAPMTVQWSRSFPIGEGLYNAVARVENPNDEAAIGGINYLFRFYGENGILLGEREGTTFIADAGVTPIFEPRIEVPAGREIIRTTFEFTTAVTPWRPLASPKEVSVESQRLVRSGEEPRIDAVIENDGFEPINDLIIVAIVYDPRGNAMAATQTIIEEFPPRSDMDVFFAWPTPFPDTVSKIEVFPRIPPDLERF
ncbi:hypothetical protein GVX82_01740 [Patescibacteria group bacterium]|jgi:hypothetical protein|nr:hypothetical protein [Patescibacteria group bacterium]